MRERLSIYKASAGSGKTFRLAVEYIKIVINNPENYNKILAVTFTNKATDEMKRRILTHLYGIAYSLPDSEPYLQVILQDKDNKLSATQIRERAKQTLFLLLHNYHYFRIETIDSFFQRIFRNLAHELQLSTNLRIELNDRQIEQNAVDSMIDSLKHGDKLLKWIINFIKSNIQDDKSWNVISKIKKFGENIFAQQYKDNAESTSKALADETTFEQFRKTLRQFITQAEQFATQQGTKFFELLDQHGIPADELKGKTRSIATYFAALSRGVYAGKPLGTESKIQKHIANSDEWVSKSSSYRQAIIQTAEETLQPFLKETEERRQQLSRLAESASLTLKNLDELRLLEHIQKEIAKQNEEAGRFLLSDTQDLLHSLIDESDSPFIYEKIGSRLEHIMIDEFQDTSTVQWNNFKILLNECMSHRDSSNLIVGDVKQSIYRWRNGDWQLLNSIDKQFPQAEGEFAIHSLNTNYRSLRRIIEFNNIFFQKAVDIEYQQLQDLVNSNASLIKEAYKTDELVQQTPSEKPLEGLIEINLLDKEDYNASTLKKIESTVKDLIENGARLSDIAILTRKNKEIALIADYFLRNVEGVKVVSDEAFMLNSSVAVTLIVDILHFISHPDDDLAKVAIAKKYQQLVKNKEFTDADILNWSEAVDSLLPAEFVNQFDQIATMPLYEMTELIYSIFDCASIPGQDSYICEFFDQIQDFLDDNPSDIDLFLKTWQETIYKASIQIDEADGIRLLTIHKSKGLEYDHVIVPFCDWETEDKRDIVWCKTDVEPFSLLPIIPIPISSEKMLGSVYADSYRQEHLQYVIDNTNLLYVAFTRAGRSLHIIGNNSKKTGRSRIIADVIEIMSKENDDMMLRTDDSTTEFRWGELSVRKQRNEEASKNVFSQKSAKCDIVAKNYRNRTAFRESNASQRFLSGEENKYIDIGTIMHNILSEITSIDQTERVLRRYEHEGLLSETTISIDKVRQMLNKSFENALVRSWFDKSNTIHTERTIITKQADKALAEYRPDRVIRDKEGNITIIDYKFGKPNEKYQSQVRGYMQQFSTMGYNNIKGYIWYVYQQRQEEVAL